MDFTFSMLFNIPYALLPDLIISILFVSFCSQIFPGIISPAYPSPSELEPVTLPVRMEEDKVEPAGVDWAKLITNENTVVDEEEDKYRFGCGPCKPACLQKVFRNSIFFTLILCIFSIVEGAIVIGIFECAYLWIYKNVYFPYLYMFIVTL